MNKPHNRIDFKKSFNDFRDKNLLFSVSSREISPDIDIMHYLKVFYMYCDIRQIESVFGSTTRFSKLYGGRLPLHKYNLTDNHLSRLAENGIHLALTLTNHFFDEASYRESQLLLEAHHKKGNSIICTNDTLAIRLKHDFPLYELKASIIKKIDTIDKVNRALELYHSLTIPMDMNDDDDFLNNLPGKHRIILFGNANCAYTCPARTCYMGFSQVINGQPVTSPCSKDSIPRLDKGYVFFDVKKFLQMGFSRFKLVPLAPPGAAEVCRSQAGGAKKRYPTNIITQNKQVHYLCSYPKCGRTWLRFIMANYFNLKYGLGMDVNLHSYFSLMPNDDTDPLKGIEAYRFSADMRFPLILSCHEEYTREKLANDKNSRIIFLFRNIPDVIVSSFFQATRELKSFDGELKAFIRDPQCGLDRYCRYLNSWSPIVQTGQAMPLTYEMLHQDADKTVANVLSFFNIPVNAVILQKAVILSSFETLQAMERQIGIPHYKAPQDDPEAGRMRKGKVEGYTDYLDKEDMDYVHRTCESLLTDASKDMLKQHHVFYIPQGAQ